MSHEITDSSDWVGTRVPYMQDLESALRCHICKEIFTSPVITQCCHTFCSLCIRRLLNSNSKCPDCRQETQTSSLRKNAVVEEIVEHYTKARAPLMELAAGQAVPSSVEMPVPSPVEDQPRKRRRTAASPVEGQSEEQQNESDIEIIEDNDSKYGTCPVCNKRMKIVEIQTTHLEQCLTGTVSNRRPTRSALYSNHDISKKLPLVHYNMMKDVKLRKVLTDFGLSTRGNRQTLEVRHREWTNLWNANADSKSPVSGRELIARLNEWERGMEQTGQNHNIKEVDASIWAQKHSQDFADLIANARQSSKKATSKVSEPSEDATVHESVN
jgi:E3 ubiquitin-protein ligase RAD18